MVNTICFICFRCISTFFMFGEVIFRISASINTPQVDFQNHTYSNGKREEIFSFKKYNNQEIFLGRKSLVNRNHYPNLLSKREMIVFKSRVYIGRCVSVNKKGKKRKFSISPPMLLKRFSLEFIIYVGKALICMLCFLYVHHIVGTCF